jgi:hypothetical protein
VVGGISEPRGDGGWTPVPLSDGSVFDGGREAVAEPWC